MKKATTSKGTFNGDDLSAVMLPRENPTGEWMIKVLRKNIEVPMVLNYGYEPKDDPDENRKFHDAIYLDYQKLTNAM